MIAARTTADAAASAPEPSELACLLTDLEQRFKTAPIGSTSLPARLPITAIERIEALFQPRPESERHLSELARVLAHDGREFDPLTVIQVGPATILIDGHHRHTAYSRAKCTEAVPVHYFTGTVREAVIEAGTANHKAKLPMTNTERQNRAWKLVASDLFTKRQAADGAGVSTSQVAAMRRVARALNGRAGDYDVWWKARLASQGVEDDMDDAAREEWLETQASDYADRMSKEFGSKLSTNVTLAARAFAVYFGRQLPELHRELAFHVPDEDDDASSEF